MRGQNTLLQRLVIAAVGAFALVVVATSLGVEARRRGPLVVRVSRDTTSGAPKFQHETEVEPSIAAGPRGLLVTVYQVGRTVLHGSARIGWATSRDGGRHWRHGYLEAITRPGVTPRAALDVTDAVASYDTVHKVWVAASIADFAHGSRTLQVNRSKDGYHWSAPIEVAKGVVDKDWLTCDKGARSSFRGRCYITFTREDQERLGVRYSVDGGSSWSSETPITSTLGRPTGSFPVVRPDGRLVLLFREGGAGVPGESSAKALSPWTFTATSSLDGGRTFGSRTKVALGLPYFASHTRAVSSAITSVVADAKGRLYAVWETCRFRKTCYGNDLALSTSANGSRWSTPRRLRLAEGDHVVPGLGIAPSKPGRAVRLGLSFYIISRDTCRPVNCRLTPYFASSTNGGGAWTRPLRLWAPIPYLWLVQAPAGQAFIGDYTTTAYVGKVAWSAVGVATRPTGARLHHSIAVARIRPIDLPHR
ncbi:MAG: hypothetical protein QOG06_2214 [Gaiellaceae bacterium]|jgi:hypothetical protein|nr:hypothetical protein [Gaiellaceae bacterium]